VVEAKSNNSESYELRIRQFLEIKMGEQNADIRNAATWFQWDDDRYGEFVAKIEWHIESKEADAPTTDEEVIALGIEDAQDENLEPAKAKVAENDIDAVHVDEHLRALQAIEPASDQYELLEQHVRDHMARLVTVEEEGPRLVRIRPWHYAYDPDVPWEERSWEAELQSVKVVDLIETRGYVNIRPENAPPEKREDVRQNAPYEDQTIRIWHIHDRRNGLHRVVSADGPKMGRFLHKSEWPYGDIDVYYRSTFRPLDEDARWGARTVQLCVPILERLATIDYYIDQHVRNHANYKYPIPDGVDGTKFKQALNDPSQRFMRVPREMWATNGGQPYEPPPIPDNLLQQRNTLLNELRRVIGVDAQDVGADHSHRITATESSIRGQATSAQKMARQEIMAQFLSWLARTYLLLYHRFADLVTNVRVQTPEGIRYEAIDPKGFPTDFDISLDVYAMTDAARAAQLVKSNQYLQFLLSSQLPVDLYEVNRWYGREMNIRRPTRFVLNQPQGPQNMMGAAAGVPGLSGGQSGGKQSDTRQSNYMPEQSESAYGNQVNPAQG